MEKEGLGPRKRGANLQQEEVFQVLNTLVVACGRVPTIRGIYEALGRRGSYTTIWAMRKPWIEAHQARHSASNLPAEAQSPEALLSQAAAAFTAREKADADTIAQLTDDAEALAEEGERTAAQLEEHIDSNAVLTRRNAELEAEVRGKDGVISVLTALLGELQPALGAVRTAGSPRAAATVAVPVEVAGESNTQFASLQACLEQLCRIALRIDSALAMHLSPSSGRAAG